MFFNNFSCVWVCNMQSPLKHGAQDRDQCCLNLRENGLSDLDSSQDFGIQDAGLLGGMALSFLEVPGSSRGQRVISSLDSMRYINILFNTCFFFCVCVCRLACLVLVACKLRKESKNTLVYVGRKEMKLKCWLGQTVK